MNSASGAARPVALITGASSGIGATFARKLADRGYDLILVARRTERLEQLAGALPTTARVIAADLATDAGLASVSEVIHACPRLEILVNNAGFGSLGRFWEASLASQDSMHRLHVLATVHLTHAALPGMTARRKGAIVNVSSVAAFSSSAGNVSYCATKAWMNVFTEGLEIELRGIGSPVRVQALCPGFTLTEFHDTLGVDRGGIPGWLWMRAEDVVDDSLRGLKRGSVIVVPGWHYKMIVAFLRCLPPYIRRRLKRPAKDKRV